MTAIAVGRRRHGGFDPSRNANPNLATSRESPILPGRDEAEAVAVRDYDLTVYDLPSSRRRRSMVMLATCPSVSRRRRREETNSMPEASIACLACQERLATRGLLLPD